MLYVLSQTRSGNVENSDRPGLDMILLGDAAERGLLDRMLDDAARMGRQNMARAAEVSLERAQSRPTLPERIAACADPAHAACDEEYEPDAYDDAVAYLTAHPEEIELAWSNPKSHRAGCLFKFATYSGIREDNRGCLTLIRRCDGRIAATPALTAAIRADLRIPTFVADIAVDILDSVFAYWQRRIDRELGRTPPARRAR